MLQRVKVTTLLVVRKSRRGVQGIFLRLRLEMEAICRVLTAGGLEARLPL
jgi:hypothetical protein